MKKAMMAAMIGFAVSSGLGELEMPAASTKTEKPKQTDEERNAALKKAQQKRERKAAKKAGRMV